MDKWDNDTWKTAKYACLNCGYVVDAASNDPQDPEPRGPEADDVTICLECSHIMIFAHNGIGGLTVREPTAFEMREITDNQEVHNLLLAMAALRRTKLWRKGHEQRKKGGHGSGDGRV